MGGRQQEASVFWTRV
uniref:Uncharacterized protein n=1 Tax=Rhizophora mucronata TaxID=61149 RepID=A0A2P2PH26_RHIMU